MPAPPSSRSAPARPFEDVVVALTEQGIGGQISVQDVGEIVASQCKDAAADDVAVLHICAELIGGEVAHTLDQYGIGTAEVIFDDPVEDTPLGRVGSTELKSRST